MSWISRWNTRADDETDTEYEVRMVQCAADHQLGDFSGIDAWEIVRVESDRDVESWTHPDKPNARRVTEHATTTYTTLLSFTEDEELAWSDAMWGSVDA